MSQYTITPSSGSVPPGNSAKVMVEFKAVGAQFYENTLAVDISGRDPTDQPTGIVFDLSAESCIPGINADDADSIFEE